MQTVEQVLSRKGRKVWTIDPDALVFDAIAEMAAKNVGALVVVEGARVVGMIAEREYARGVALLGRSSCDTRVRDIMRTHLPAVSPQNSLCDCMALMSQHRTRHLAVMVNEELVGILSIGDTVAAIIEDQRQIIERLEQCLTTG